MKWRKRVIYDFGKPAGKRKIKWFHVYGGVSFIGKKWAARFDCESASFPTLASAKKWVEAQSKLRRQR